MVIFDGVSAFPVKTYVATDNDAFERHMYHGFVPVMKDGKPVMKDGVAEMHLCGGSMKQDLMSCEICGTKAGKTDPAIVKGLKFGDKLVVVTDEAVNAQKPMSDSTMKLTEYVDPNEINPKYIESTEYIAPDKGGEIPFAVLVAALQRTNKVAKGVRVKGGKEQYFVVRPEGQNGLVLSYLFAEYEVRKCDKWTPLAVPDKVVDLTAKLIEANTVKFTPAPADRFLTNVRKYVRSLFDGTTAATVEAYKAPAATDNLEDALLKALANAQAAKAAKAGK